MSAVSSRGIKISKICWTIQIEMHSQGKNNRFNTLFKGHQTFLSCDGLRADKNIEEITANNAVYQLQPIEFTRKQISIFCDNGCDDFVSTYDTVKRICTNPTQ